ncbi:MAG: hypothetical protein CMD88_02450 [Gammaproteobacteria bacterium]|nr:hypothetical protein [Gammaproteobacteria bacterium]|tara:strand:- start:154 stop:456 length:303 start_codon:yes stop_codon:yes gene_type:complete
MRNKIISINLIYINDNPKLKISLLFKIEKGVSIKKFFKYKEVSDVLKKISISKHKFGIFGNIVRDDYILQNHDRLEIYNPIKLSPKTRRNLILSNKRKSS